MNPIIEKLQSILVYLSRFSDIVFASLLVLIISVMILPVPFWLLDLLIALDLALAVILLMMALYIPGILAFSTFPSLLLFTTLFRLSLNVTSTRLILLDGYAGEIIYTFGNFVVAGNFIVGAVVFLIITIVQFVVITKGAERVAEVAARFTLDAMPGKQMSIDADLRAGVIKIEDARKRRSILEKENQLHGAMDGAMKFVKGDSIAGLIITAVNIVGGLAIGMLTRDMPFEKAITTYGILTIGDGLVSQIPALLIAITSGIIVTRVTTDEQSTLSNDVIKQILAQPKATLIGGGMMLGFALIPGFPWGQFLGLAAIMLSGGYYLLRKSSVATKKTEPSFEAMTTDKGREAGKEGEGHSPEFSITVPLMIDASSSIKQAIEPAELNRELIRIRKALYLDLGVPFPGIHLRFNETLDSNLYRILLQEVPISEGHLKAGYALARESKENLKMLGIDYIEEKNFLPHIPSLWVPNKNKAKLSSAGIPTMEIPQILTYHLSFILQKYSAEFLGLQETKYLLEKMEGEFAEIVREVQRVLPMQKITEVFQRLVQEGISIRNLRLILQALIEWGQKEKEPVLLTEYVRSTLKRYISYKFSGGHNLLAVYLLEPDVEEQLRKAIRQTSAGSYLALDPNTAQRLVANIKKEVGDITQNTDRPVLLTSMDVRRYLRKLIELEMHELPVLSHQELTEEITIQPIGRISL